MERQHDGFGDGGWWYGKLKNGNSAGTFPSNYITKDLVVPAVQPVGGGVKSGADPAMDKMLLLQQALMKMDDGDYTPPAVSNVPSRAGSIGRAGSAKLLSGGRSTPAISSSSMVSSYSSGGSSSYSSGGGGSSVANSMAASQLEMAKKEIESLKKELDRLRKTLAEKDKDKDRDRDKNRKEFERQKQVIGEQERSIAALKQKLQTAEKESTMLTTNLRKVEDIGRGAGKDIDRLRAENGDLKQQVNELRAGLNEAMRESQKAAQGLRETGKLAEENFNLKMQNTNTRQLQMQITDLTRRLEVEEQKAIKFQREAEDSRRKVESNVSLIQDLQMEARQKTSAVDLTEELQAELKRKDGVIDSLTAKLEELMGQLERTRRDATRQSGNAARISVRGASHNNNPTFDRMPLYEHPCLWQEGTMMSFKAVIRS